MIIPKNVLDILAPEIEDTSRVAAHDSFLILSLFYELFVKTPKYRRLKNNIYFMKN